MTEAIAYYRVSTQKQGESGLGLEAQRHLVERYARGQGLTIAAEYTEVETGTRKRRRPELERALEDTRRRDATLLIAKLDRLARNVAFISALIESGVDFTACDMPEANKMTIHILAAVAENEAELISQRTKAALAAAKRRGVKLGNPENLPDNAGELAGLVMRKRAREAYRKESGYIAELRRQGLSYDHIAKRLNVEGWETRTGKPFKAMTVWRIVQRGNGA